MAKVNITRYILLGLLSHEAMSGYDMKKRMDIAISHFWPVGFGQIYPTLSALLEEGLIEKSISETSKGPEKHLYIITEKGREALRIWLSQPEEREYTKYEMLLKLFFGAQGNILDDIDRIEAFSKRHQENLQLMRLFKAELSGIMVEKDHLYYYLTVLFGECIYEAYCNWAEQAQSLLREAANKEKEHTS